jgi:enamine deaminase RidA (YjgF/YER057c/UK114 family)
MTNARVDRINPPSLPAVPGYSQVVAVSGADFVFIAGQVSLDAAGAVVGVGDFAA